MKSFIQFIKDWMLPISMGTGILLYLVYHNTPALYPAGPLLNKICTSLQPIMVFLMLFLQFVRVAPTDVHFKKWHLWLLLIQGSVFTITGLLMAHRPETDGTVLVETAMLCLICPTALAAGVITDKLGGSLSGIMSYMIMINVLVSFLIPSIVPLLHPMEGRTFWISFLLILRRVFSMLILPCVLAWLIRYLLPKLHKRLTGLMWAAFYLWSFSLMISLILTTRSLVLSKMSMVYALAIGLISLICCVVQFRLGRVIGKRYSHADSVTAGQALGQKNTVFIIWLGYNFMTPTTSIAGGFYCIWHNFVNSYELYRQRILSEKSTSKT
ncbi:MAG: transporter [Bacteroidales bacterium]